MLLTDAGQMIRVGVARWGINGRKTQGVIVFQPGDTAWVVAVERLFEEGEENGE
jgi:hypothetical protein